MGEHPGANDTRTGRRRGGGRQGPRKSTLSSSSQHLCFFSSASSRSERTHDDLAPRPSQSTRLCPHPEPVTSNLMLPPDPTTMRQADPPTLARAAQGTSRPRWSPRRIRRVSLVLSSLPHNTDPSRVVTLERRTSAAWQLYDWVQTCRMSSASQQLAVSLIHPSSLSILTDSLDVIKTYSPDLIVHTDLSSDS